MGLLNKLKPYPVDLLLYGLPKSADLPDKVSKIFPFPIEFCEKDSQFIIKLEGKVIHRSKLFNSSYLLRNFGYRQPYVTVGDCHTDDKYRGKGIYPNVIHHILIQYRNTHDVYMLVAPTNIASIQGIKRAGLKPMARLQCLKMGPIYLRKKTFKID